MRAFGGWQVGSFDAAAAQAIADAGCCKRLTAALLNARGIAGPEAAVEFLREDEGLLCDPMTMKDMDRAVERIRRAVAAGEHVAVYGDYDVDGLTASALMTDWLQRRGLKCETYVPERLTEGYGISDEALHYLQGLGVSLIITVDCGITAAEQVQLARRLGMDVVVTDHHECQGELPEAAAVVDPRRKDCPYPFKGLAGVGVAFKLLCALEGPEHTEALLERYAPLAAMGTIADIMPVTGENRVLIRLGVLGLRQQAIPGLDSLMQAINVEKGRITGTDISFALVPKLNAAGRMGRVRTAFDLLMARDAAESDRLALELCQMNAERRNVENRVFEEAREMLGEARNLEKPIVLASDTWHHGVSGIVASRLADRYGVPAVVICLEGEEGRGSCRSYGGFCIFDALEAASELLTTFGGHELAAGLTLHRDRVEDLRQALGEYYMETEGERLQPRLPVDFCVEDLSLLTLEEIDALKRMSPWGVGNPPPTLCLRDMRIDSLVPIGGDKHLKMRVSRGGLRFDCVWFGVSVRELGMQTGMQVDLAFEPGVNEFRGSRTVQLLLRDVRPAREPNAPSLLLAERFLAGERLQPMEHALLLPDRNEFGRVWRHISQRARRFAEEPETLLPDIALRAGVRGLGRVLICLRVFDELGLIRLREQDGCYDISIPRFSGKADLNSSKLLQRLR